MLNEQSPKYLRQSKEGFRESLSDVQRALYTFWLQLEREKYLHSTAHNAEKERTGSQLDEKCCGLLLSEDQRKRHSYGVVSVGELVWPFVGSSFVGSFLARYDCEGDAMRQQLLKLDYRSLLSSVKLKRYSLPGQTTPPNRKTLGA
eukprot:5145194-Amphidinium_carterae.1